MSDPLEIEREKKGVTQALLERLGEQRIPRVLAIRSRLDAGLPLHDLDLIYLTDITEDLQRNRHHIEDHVELTQIYHQVVALYHEVAAKALMNEAKLPH